MRELAERVIEATGSKSKIIHLPLPQDDPRQRLPDISAAENVLSWHPRTDFETGLSKTISYFEHILSHGGVRLSAGAIAR
jgi:UDP-glucuronate decarboxylase